MKNTIAHFLPKPSQTSKFTYSYISELLGEQPDLTHTFFTTNPDDDLKSYFTDQIVVKTNESLYNSELQHIRPQVIHVHGLEPSAAGLAFAICNNIPLIISIYDNLTTSLLTNPPWPDYFKSVFQHCSRFLVSSNIIRNQLIDHGCPQKEITHINAGVNLDYFQLPNKKPASKTTTFLAFVPLTEVTEIKLAIDSFIQLIQTSPNIQLTIISEAQPRVDILNYIRKQNNKITLIRITDTEKYTQYLQSADIFLYVGKTSALNEEILTLNAMAYGLPIIAVNNPELAEIVQDKLTGFLVAKDDKKALLQHMKELHLSNSLATEMGTKARQFIDDYHNIKKIRKELASCYSSLIKTKREIYNFKKEENYCQKILLVRSIPLIDFLHKLFFIKEEFPYSEIFVLTNSTTLAQCQAHPLIDRVIEFTGKRFSPFQLKAKQRKMLNKRFDKTIVPFTNEKGNGFENVVAMAKLLGSRETLGLNKNHKLLKLNWLIILKPIINKKLFSRMLKKVIILTGVSLAILFLSICYLIIKLVSCFIKPKTENETS